MTTLEQEIYRLRKQCDEMEEAIALLKHPQRYEPRQGENAPLDFLKAELSAINSQSEREKLLQQAQVALEKSRATLQTKEAELESLKADCALIDEHMASLGQSVLTLQTAYQQALSRFEQLAAENQRRWQELHPGQELFSKLSRVEFPAFRMLGSRGILTTEAIARDLG